MVLVVENVSFLVRYLVADWRTISSIIFKFELEILSEEESSFVDSEPGAESVRLSKRRCSILGTIFGTEDVVVDDDDDDFVTLFFVARVKVSR